MQDADIRVLALGALPRYLGGRSTHGLATGVFDLVDAMNELDAGVKVILCAPDCKKEKMIVRSTPVLGANAQRLLAHIRKYPLRTARYGALSLMYYSRLGMNPKSSFSRFILYDYAVEKVRPHVISAHGPARGILANRLSGKKGCEVVLRIHGISGMDSNIKNHRSAKKQEGFVAGQVFSAVTHISTGDKKEWQKFYGPWKCPVEVILNGYRSDIFSPAAAPIASGKKKSVRLVTVATLQPRKGQLKVIRAIARLHKQDVEYICAGDGADDYKERLIEEAGRLQVDLRLTGYLPQDKVSDLLRSADYMILPSSSEGFGKVYIESIACGTSVIIPRHIPLAREPGVLTGENSILVDGPDTNSITTALQNLPEQHNPNKVAETVRHLSWDNLARRYISLIRKVWSNHSN